MQQDPLETFREHIMRRWDAVRDRLLTSVQERRRALSQDEHAMLDVLCDGMSLLAPLGATRKERLHQAAFVWALSGSGAVGEACRAAWAREHGLVCSTRQWRITAEHVLDGDRRVDVRIEADGWALHLIEMKVDAGEGEAQLHDYRRHLDEDGAQWAARELVFITPEGRRGDPSVVHRAMSWSDVVRLFLPAALGQSAESRYLAMWLVTLAREVCQLSDQGPFEDWSLARQEATLDLIEGTRSSNVPAHQ